MIERSITPKILEALTFFPSVGLVGPRQVGKTTLLKLIQPMLDQPVLFLDLERDSDLQRLGEAELFLSAHMDKCVIIDEVQTMPKLFPLIRWLIDQNRRPARFIFTGSASPDIVKNNTETLAGRITYFEVSPFSLLEVQSTIQTDTHWFRGGFPDALLAPSDFMTGMWLESFIETFLYRDIQLIGHEITVTAMERLLKILGSYNGQLLNYQNLSNSLDISVPTLKRYLDILEGSFMIRRLQPHHVNITKRLVKSPKIFIRDTGLLHSLLGLQSLVQLQGSHNLGSSWEAYVIEQIFRVFGKRWEYSFFRTQTGAEVDLVMKSPAGKLICIEIKYSVNPSPSKGFFVAIADLKPDEHYIIIPGHDFWERSNGLKVCGLSYFLQNVNND
jgi:uncharacterized protein